MEYINYGIQILVAFAGFYLSWKELRKAISTGKWFKFFLVAFIPIATLFSIYLTYKADVSRATSLQVAYQKLDTLQNYTYVSKLGYNGSDQEFFSAMDPEHPIIPPGLAQILIGTSVATGWTIQGTPKGIEYKCDANSQKKYLEAIAFNPNYPFSYYALAICEKNANNQEWQYHAQKSLEIFKITTTIDGHNSWHDAGLEVIERILKDQ